MLGRWCARDLLDLLEALVPPVFVVRLLNPTHADYNDVQRFFDTVVQLPVMEGELGYKLTVVDGNQAYDHARIDQEIFTKLHHPPTSPSSFADITHLRPIAGAELCAGPRAADHGGEGTNEHPFDICSLSGHHWRATVGAGEMTPGHAHSGYQEPSPTPTCPCKPLIP